MADWPSNSQHHVPDALWAALVWHRWHATAVDGLRGIVEDGIIKAGSHYDSVCGSLGAVSIFDFGSRAKDCRLLEHWSRWCGRYQAEQVSLGSYSGKAAGVWLRVRDAYAGSGMIDPETLWECSKSQWFLKIMRGVEGAHMGVLPMSEIDQVVVTDESMAFRVWDSGPSEVVDEVTQYVDALPSGDLP